MYQKFPTKNKKKKKKRRSRESKDKTRWYYIKKKYGLSKEEYFKILAEQNGVCYICQRTPEKAQRGKRARHLSVDHDHVTGHVRGLLCTWCNGDLLPPFERDVQKLERMLIYLTKEHNYGKVPLFQ